MNLSLGEFRALSAKALRGAGYSWGLTEDGAFATGRLAEFGYPVGDMLVRLLAHVDGRSAETLMPSADWSSPAESLCPIHVGTALSDLGSAPLNRIGPTVEPLLLAPFLQLVAPSNEREALVLSWSDGQCWIRQGAIQLEGPIPEGVHDLTIGRRSATTDVLTSRERPRVELSDSTKARLEGFAHRTYAPATEASRSGAGAATSDND